MHLSRQKKGRFRWPGGPLQSRALADRLEKLRSGFWDPDKALAAFRHRSFVAEESERGVEARAGRVMAPTRKHREDPIAADRLPRFQFPLASILPCLLREAGPSLSPITELRNG